MIQINLLPVREWRRREAVRRQISIFFLSLVLIITGMFAVGWIIQGRLMAKRDTVNSLEERKKKLAYVDKKITSLNKKIKQVENKFKAIERLQEGRTLTVKALDEIVSAIPIDRLWITKLSFKGNKMQLTGVALDNHTVALFMRRLEFSPMCRSVNLKNTKRKSVQEQALMEFGLQVNVQFPKKKDDKTKSSKKTKKVEKT